MDPLSAILLLGAGAAVAAGAQQEMQGASRTQALQGALGMAIRPPAPPSEEQLPVEGEELPDEAPAHWSDASLWDIFNIPGMYINLALNSLEWMDNKADLDEVLHHSGYSSQGLGYWQVRGEAASKEPRSLWRLMHLAWLGRMPTLTIDVRYNADGQGASGEMTVSAGFIDIDLRILGDEMESTAEHLMESWLHDDDKEIGGEVFTECAEGEIYSNLTVWGHHIVLGHVLDTIGEETFTGTMAELAKKLEELHDEANETESEVSSELNSIARKCTDVALEEVEAYRKTYELEHGDEDDDEDDWDEDDWTDEEDED